MEKDKEFQREFWIMTLKWGTPAVLGLISLLISTFLTLTDRFYTTPSYVFRIINGISIVVIIIFAFIWSQKNKNLQNKYHQKESTEQE